VTGQKPRWAQPGNLADDVATADQRLRAALGLPPGLQLDYGRSDGKIVFEYVPPPGGLVDECDTCNCHFCVMSGPHERHGHDDREAEAR
jgi:hypothetical protein